MQPRNRFAYVYIVVGLALIIGWSFLQNYFWPPAEKPKLARPIDVVGFYGSGLAAAGLDPDVDVFRHVALERATQFPSAFGGLAGGLATAAEAVEARKLTARERELAAAKNVAPAELVPMGRGEKPFHLQVLLNTRGGSVQQVVLTEFQGASREGLPVLNPDGTPRKLHLIPGVIVPRTPKMSDQPAVPIPTLEPGKIIGPHPELAQPSYLMYHYARESDEKPVDTLGTKLWRVVRNEAGGDDTQVVAFETELEAPFYVRITKTYTLSRSDYHLGLDVTLTPTERPAGARVEPLRYQMTGPRNMPIEGEWYTTTYRQGVVGWEGGRVIEMPQTVRYQGGTQRYKGEGDRPIRYAGVMIQYFASVLALANQPGQKPDYIEYVRFTPEGPVHANEKERVDQTFLDDLTFRAISKKIDPTVAVTHPFVLYQGPAKVRLLKQLEGDQAVPNETVNRYLYDLNLRTLTDAPSPTFIGRFANAIFWADIVIAFTNLIHSLLGLLTNFIPNLGLCILILTIVVRGVLHPLTRRQAINAKIMQAKQARLAPEFKKIQEKYGDDIMKVQAEKSKLMREHGINPAAALGGCLPLLLQMPIFMGLYFALQESVFFRLEAVTPWWIPNLAAPDMLIRWGETIPYISAPENLGSTFYLGPYFNLLPLIAVALMMYTQSKMMPKSEDPQVQMQQKMMKIMMIFMLFFFYKVAAGLAIYFIASSLWGMIERQLLPKDIEKLEAEREAAAARKKEDREERGEPTGWLGKKMAGWREKWSQILEEAQKQQQAQREQRPGQTRGPVPNGPPGPAGQNRKKKKKR